MRWRLHLPDNHRLELRAAPAHALERHKCLLHELPGGVNRQVPALVLVVAVERRREHRHHAVIEHPLNPVQHALVPADQNLEPVLIEKLNDRRLPKEVPDPATRADVPGNVARRVAPQEIRNPRVLVIEQRPRHLRNQLHIRNRRGDSAVHAEVQIVDDHGERHPTERVLDRCVNVRRSVPVRRLQFVEERVLAAPALAHKLVVSAKKRDVPGVFAEQRENKGDNLGRKLPAVNVVAEEQDVAHTLVVNAVENAEEIDEIAVEIADNVNWRPFSDEHWHRHESSRCLVRELDDDLRRKEGN